VSSPVALGLPTLRRSAAAGSAAETASPASAPALPVDRPADRRLVDRFGRVATDLRVSLTDRCSLRCSYCMPAEGLEWLPTEQVLTDEEVVRLIAVAVERLGVREVRFTGCARAWRRSSRRRTSCGRRPASRRTPP
jgi:cyclic pyranopterin phosphate synthase